MKIFIGPHEVTPEDLRNIHLEIDEPGEELEAVHITVKGGRLHIKPSGDAAALTVAYDGPASPGIIIGEYEGSGYHAIYDLLQVMRYNLPDERVVELYKLGWELSTYAAAIHWDGSRNTREYLNGLRLKINAYQEAHKALFGKQPGIKQEATLYNSSGRINTFHRSLGNQAVKRYAEVTNYPADMFVWVEDPQVGVWYDFYDLATQKYGQCKLTETGWAQEPLGLFPALIALRETP